MGHDHILEFIFILGGHLFDFLGIDPFSLLLRTGESTFNELVDLVLTGEVLIERIFRTFHF